MFLYWDGFEIDGSDTDFSIILPENVQICEFVECFLSIPIFSSTPKPTVSYTLHGRDKEQELNFAELKEKLLAGNYPDTGITVLCRHVEQLPDEVHDKVYAISEQREPHEAAYGKSENPCTAPYAYTQFDRGGMTVELRIQQPGTKHGFDNVDELYGYVHNSELFRSANQEHSCFNINVGPGFYYEYAIFIIAYLCDHFPGIGVCGGLDCGGGWTGGCTYANSLYYLERILLPVKHSVRNTLKRLTEYDIVRSWSHYSRTQKGVKYELTYEYGDGYYPAWYPWWVKPSEIEKPLSFAEYVELVDMTLELDDTSFSMVCETAIRIMLPPPEEYTENPEALKKLRAALPNSENQNFTGYFAFTKIDGKPMAEFRVPYLVKKYLLTLLELADSGAIDFIKPVTYQRRHKDE